MDIQDISRSRQALERVVASLPKSETEEFADTVSQMSEIDRAALFNPNDLGVLADVLSDIMLIPINVVW